MIDMSRLLTSFITVTLLINNLGYYTADVIHDETNDVKESESQVLSEDGIEANSDDNQEKIDLQTGFLYNISDEDTIRILGYQPDQTEWYISAQQVDLRTISIPEYIQGFEVSEIGEGAFKGNNEVAKVVIPESVKSIESEAFSDCGLLSEVMILSESIKLGQQIFEGSVLLETITVNSGIVLDALTRYLEGTVINIEQIGVQRLDRSFDRWLPDSTDDQFEFNQSYPEEVLTSEPDNPEQSDFVIDENGVLTSYIGTEEIVNIPETVTKIGRNAFRDNKTIKKVLLPEGLTEIGYSGFYQCLNLEEIFIPSTVEVIDSYSFYKCSKLAKINLPDSLVRIGDYGFAYCSGLTEELNLPFNLDKIGGYGFYNCVNISGNLEIPESVSSLGSYCFSGCKNISGDLVIHGNLKSIGTACFNGCTGLTGSLLLEEGVEVINNYAFAGCGFNGELTIPTSIKKVGGRSFQNCPNISKVRVKGAPLFQGTNESWSPFISMTSLVTIEFMSTSVPSFESDVFRDCNKLENIIVPLEGYLEYQGLFSEFLFAVKVIPNHFEDQFIIIDNQLAGYIGDETSVSVPNGVVAIGPGAFRSNSTITNIYLPDTVTEIQNSAFYNCKTLADINIPNRIEKIGSNAFRSCPQLKTKLVLPESLTEIGRYAFCGDVSLEQIECEASLIDTVNQGTFKDCSGLSGSITLPASLKTIGDEAFSGVSLLRILGIEQTCIETIGEKAFYNCSNITDKLSLPNTLKTIGKGAFSGCVSISGSIQIPDSVTIIQTDAFNGLSCVEEVALGSTLKTISSPFKSMNSLHTIKFSGETPPSTGQFLRDIPNLKKVIVPVNSIEDYINIFSSYLPAGARILPDSLEGDFYINGDVLVSYFGDDELVVIPEGIRTIGTNAFKNNTNLKGIALPTSVEEIQNNAFQNCSGLISIDFNEGLKSIGNDAFSGDVNLSTFSFPSTIEYLGDRSFSGCTSLSNLVLNDGLLTIGKETFKNCENIKELDLPSSLSQLGNSAFLGCKSLSGKITFPSNLINLGINCFMNCSSLEAVEFKPSEIIELPNGLFSGCSNLKSVEGLETLEKAEKLGSSIFKDCKLLENKILLPHNLKNIGESVFYGCNNLRQALSVPDGVERIGARAFYQSGFTELYIPDSVTYIDYYCFCYMDNLRIIDLGSNFSINTYAAGPFSGTENIEIFRYRDKNPPDISGMFYGYLHKWDRLERFEVPPESYSEFIDALKKAESRATRSDRMPEASRLYPLDQQDDWFIKDGVLLGYYGSDEIIEIPECVTSIGIWAFKNVPVKNVVFHDEVSEINEEAFLNCKELTGTLHLPAGLQNLARKAFDGCVSLSGTITIPEGVSYLDYWTFRNCSGINKVIVTGDLDHLDFNAFAGLTNLESIELHTSRMPEITNDKLSNWPNLKLIKVYRKMYPEFRTRFTPDILGKVLLEQIEKIEDDQEFIIDSNGMLAAYFGYEPEVTIPEGVTSIAPGAFQNNLSLISVILPDGLDSIGDSAFDGCENLKYINYPDSLVSIGGKAFYKCKSLEKIVMPARLEKIGISAFEECTKASSFLYVPGTLKEISDRAFYNCSSLCGVAFEEGVENIGMSAFYRCIGLTSSLILPDSIKEVRGNAFYGCKNLNGEIRLSPNITKIGLGAFGYCENLKGQLIIPDGVTGLSGNIFGGMKSITSVVLGKNLKTISVGWSNRVNGIGENPFRFMGNVDTLIYTGDDVIYNNDDHIKDIFGSFNLKKIFVPLSSYAAYYEGYKKYLGDRELLTDLYTLPVSGLRADSVYSHSAHIYWNPHLEEKIQRYIVLKDGKQVAEVEESQCVIKNLEPGKDSEMSVYGVDENGLSTPVQTISVSPVEWTADQIHSECNESFGDVNNSLYATVTNNSLSTYNDARALEGTFYLDTDLERILLGPGELQTNQNAQGKYEFKIDLDTSSFDEGEHKFVFELKDPDGLKSETSAVLNLSRKTPQSVEGLTAVADVNQIILSWRIAKDADTDHYKLYRMDPDSKKFKYVMRVNERETVSAIDGTVTGKRSYGYAVAAVNTAGVEGPLSEPVYASLSDDKEPPVVLKILPVNAMSFT